MAPPGKTPPSNGAGAAKGPAKSSRKFSTNDKIDRPSYVEADDYFSPTKKSQRSTAYTAPLSLIDEDEASQRTGIKGIPLTAENLQNLQEAQEAESPPSDNRFSSHPSLRAFMRKSKSRSPEKKKVNKKKNKDQDEHPLNLPPDQLRQLSARMAKDEKRDSSSMDVDADSDVQPDQGTQNSQPPTPGSNPPGAFPSSDFEYTNGDTREQTKSPTPPPHRVNTQPKIDPEVAKASGNKYFKNKDYGRAITEYTKAIEAAPDNATYLSNRAAAYMANYQYEAALSDCLQASYLDAGNEKVLHRLARIYTFLGRPEDALFTYDKIPLASATDTASAQKAKRCIEIAEQQMNSPEGDGKMALWNINQAKQTLGPGTPMPRKWRLLVARANLKIGSANSLGEVQAIAQDMMRDNSVDAEAIVLLGQALYMKDDKGPDGVSDYKRADDCFKKALQLDPDNKEAKISRSLLKAMEAARSSANSLYTRKSYQAAADAYTEALKIDPKNKVTNAKLLHNRALCRMYLEDYDAAKADCNQALKLDPTYTKAKKAKAKVVGNAGDWKQAVEDLKSVQEESPEDPTIAKDIRDAEFELKKAARKDYYKILGVSKSADSKEIERAYKKKAAVLHPDKTGGDEEKEAQFKDCLEAKETLCDPQKRAAYDSGADLMEPSMGGSPFGGGFGGAGGGVQIDPEMLFNMMNGGMGGRGGGMGGGFPGGFRFSSGGPGMGGGRGGFPF